MAVRRQLSLESSDTAASSSVPCRKLVCAIRGGVVVTATPGGTVTSIVMVVVSVARVEDIVTRHERPVVPESSWNAISVGVIDCIVNFLGIQFLRGE